MLPITVAYSTVFSNQLLSSEVAFAALYFYMLEHKSSHEIFGGKFEVARYLKCKRLILIFAERRRNDLVLPTNYYPL
jgi:hypothetical protein